jgi:phosphoribosylglycinamide formyltransferase-1
MIERFVSEQLRPFPEELNITSAVAGEPAIPRKFKWRGDTIEVAEVIRKWKTTSPCTHGSDERYVRKHWYEIETVDGRYLRIYFERQARSRRERKKRWWVFSEIENNTSSNRLEAKENSDWSFEPGT